MRKPKPVESFAFPGMEHMVEEQKTAQAELKAEEMTAQLRETLGDVSRKAEEMELNSPLFFGKVHPALFTQEEEP